MYKRGKNTVYLDLKFIKNKGLILNIKYLYNLTIDSDTGKMIEINNSKTSIKKNDYIVMHNLTFYDLLKYLEKEKHWHDFENKK